MRLNKFLAHNVGLARRAADEAIAAGRVTINNQLASLGAAVQPTDIVKLDDHVVTHGAEHQTIMLNKPVGFVSSRRAQGQAKTIYELLPANLRELKPVGRLDKNSSGLLLLSSDGDFAHRMTHPKFHKNKVYLVRLDKPLAPLHQQMISDVGVSLTDGRSQLNLTRLDDSRRSWQVAMFEGRNRQIRRTFAALGYDVKRLHRVEFGAFRLGDLARGEFQVVKTAGEH
jgi:23S rRNA pseudouridine2605 synthase